MSEYVPIPEDKAKNAFETCMTDPGYARYYLDAPEGARPYIALQFYLNVYSAEVSKDVAASYYQEVEADLTTPDIAYLIKFERDADVRDHLLDLMTKRSAPAPQKMKLRRVQEVKAEKTPAVSIRAAEKKGALTEQEQIRQHESVVAVEARWNAENRKQRIRTFRNTFKEVFYVGLLLALLGALGFYLYGRYFKGRKLKVTMPTVELTDTEAERQRKAAEAEAERQRKAAEEEAERKRKAAEEEAARLAKQQQEEAEKVAKARKDAYDQLVRQFGMGRIDYWKNAPQAERPGKAKETMTYHCVMPNMDEPGKAIVLKLLCVPEKPMTVTRLSPDADPEEMSVDTFNQMAAQTPYLVMREDKVYFCSPKRKAREYTVPIAGESFNPSKEEFGELYDTLAALDVTRLALSWKVGIVPKGETKPLDVAIVSYGEELTRSRFRDAVRKVMNEVASNRAKQRAVSQVARKLGRRRTVVLYDGDSIRRSIDGVTQVPRTFVFQGSTKNRYSYSSYAKSVEERKEAAARDKWEKLYQEARRQEAAEQELKHTKEREFSVSVDAQQVENVLATGKVVFTPAERN